MDAPKLNHVLLIESDPEETEVYSDLIRDVGDCEIDMMTRVEGSFDWLVRSNYHLIVIDTASFEGSDRQFSGLDVLERIKRIRPGTSVILLSGEATVEEAVAAIRLGAEDYFKKPFNLDKFKLAVKRGLDRKTVFGEDTGATDYLYLLNSCRMISATLEQEKIFEIIQSFFMQELSSNYAAVYTVGGRYRSSPSNGPGAVQEQDSALEEILEIAVCAVNPFEKMIQSNEIYHFFDRGQLTPGLFVFRFRCAGAEDFFCVTLSPKKPLSMEAFENRLLMLKRQIEVTGKNIEEYRGVQHLVYLDDATGLYNTRYLNNVLDREIAHAQGTKKSFAVLFIDVDKFKTINDSHGHLVGTRLLNELGNHLKTMVRGSDTVFRYGGDEFVAVLAPCDQMTAEMVAERIREFVEGTSFLHDEGMDLRFTVSIGVALFPDHADSKKSIIQMADQAMYTAKKKSRNRVYVVEKKASGSQTA